MHVSILHMELNQNAAQDLFCTDQAGAGKLPFAKATGISPDKQDSTGGQPAWLAPLGSPQEWAAVCEENTNFRGDSAVCHQQGSPRPPAEHSKVQAPHISHIALPAWRVKLRNESLALWYTNPELSFNLCVAGSCTWGWFEEGFP